MQISGSLKKDMIVLLLIGAVPLLLLLFSQQWFYTPAGWLDPFMYLGYFKYYFQHDPVRHLDEYYKSSRLPWIIPGSVVYRFFSYKTAHFILNISVLYYIYFSFYFLSKRLFSVNTAALSSLLFCFYSELHGNGGWEYHMGISIAYQLTSLIFLMRWLDREDFLSALLSGVFFICAVHNHPPYLATLSVNFFLIFRVKKFRLKKYFHYGLFFALGALFLTGLLMLYSRINGYPSLFFMPQIRYVLSLQKTAAAGNDWLLKSRHLIFAAAVFVSVFYYTVQNLVLGKYIFRPMHFSFLFLGSVFLYLQIRGQAVLEADYQAVLLSPFAFLAFAQMIDFLEPVNDREMYRTLLSLFLAGVSGYLFIFGYFYRLIDEKLILSLYQNNFMFSIPLFFLLLLSAAVAYWKENKPLRYAAYFFAIWIFSSFMNKNPLDYSFFAKEKNRPEIIRMIDKADDYIHKYNPGKSFVRTWYDASESAAAPDGNTVSTGNAYSSLSSYYGWCGVVLNCGSPNRFPKISKEELDQHPKDFVLAVIGTDKGTYSLAENSLTKEHGRKLIKIGETSIEAAGLVFYLTMTKVEKTVQ